MQQADDFRAESRALADVIRGLGEADFDHPTQFKGWSIDDVIGHLHMFNVAAEKALASDAAFQAFFAPVAKGMAAGQSMRDVQYVWLDGLRGRALARAWEETFERTASAYAQADPKVRVKWAGPDMSALSSITARQMETWAHGQEVFDLLGAERQEQDRIRNIAHLGVATFGWTHINRGLPVPYPAPYVHLTGPSGTEWEWNTPQTDNCVTGDAVEFACVTAQTRNIADTALNVTGDTARTWMQIAQCFAGPPEDPPAKGARYTQR